MPFPVNSGFRLYEVDSETWDILDAHTWYSNVSSYPSLDSQTQYGPSYKYEYSTRQAYGGNITWPQNAPLNATWWHRVTENMLADNGSLVEKYNSYQGKMSVLSPNCTSRECVEAKVCYIRVSDLFNGKKGADGGVEWKWTDWAGMSCWFR